MELEMPFLRDRPGAQMLTMNVAGRRSEYENIGGFGTTGETGKVSFNTWKFAFVYDPVTWLRLRGSRSQDLRAASFRELYYSQSIPPGGIFGYVQNPTVPPGTSSFFGNPAWLILSGNPNLQPEESLTETIGFVVSPGGAAEGLHFSADYYEITLKGGQRLDTISLGRKTSGSAGWSAPRSSPRSRTSSTRIRRSRGIQGQRQRASA
jgi:iron complex outermembrane recepter protein